MIATCSNIHIPRPSPRPTLAAPTPTREIFEQVLDVTWNPVKTAFLDGPRSRTGGYFAQCFQSEAIDKEAHIKQRGSPPRVAEAMDRGHRGSLAVGG